MKFAIYSTIVLAVCLLNGSCGTAQKGIIHELPDDLTTIDREDVKPIAEQLENAKIIGVTECVHDMIEPFLFRNALIRELVESRQIKVIAIESGFPESRLVHDYILGKDIEIDDVLSNGMSCRFGEIESNRELLVWLRDYNKNRPSNEQVHFYGFDIPGCAPNPIQEDARAGFNYVSNYLDRVDREKSDLFRKAVKEYEVFLRIKDGPEDSLEHFWDLDSTGWNTLESILDDVENTFERNSERYIEMSSELDYKWAFRSIHCARQNVIFLRSIGKPDVDYDTRDFGQFENIQWIIENEPNKNLLLFAHSTHLMKEVHTDPISLLPYPRCGEYLGKEYGNDYQVIGNIFRKLDWLDGDTLEVEEGYLGHELSKLGPNNYFMDINQLDKKWDKEWCIRNSDNGAKVLIDLMDAVDFIYFNDTQTTLFVPQED